MATVELEITQNEVSSNVEVVEQSNAVILTIIENESTVNIEIVCNGVGGGNNGIGDVDLSYSKISEVNVGGIRVGDVVEPDYKSALDKIFSAPFNDLAFSYSVNYGLVEKGLFVSPTSSWNISSNDDTVTNVSILRNNIEESNRGTVLSGSYMHLDSIGHTNSSSERTYKINILATDAILKSSSKIVSFVAPTYSGILDVGDVNEGSIKGLAKYIRSKSTHSNVSFSPVLQRYVYSYPKSFGLLSSIKDPSNFESLGSFDVSESTFTLADATTEAMYIYTSNADTTQTNFDLDFIF